MSLGSPCGLGQVVGVDVSTGQFTRFHSCGFLHVSKIAACDGGARGLDLRRCGPGDAISYGCRELAGRQTEGGLGWLAI
jgi:hypothetical protein